MDGDVEQPAVLFDPHRRHAGDRGQHLSVADDAQPSRPLAHQQRAVGQELDAPRRVESVGEDLGAEGVTLAVDPRRQGQRRWRQGAEPGALLRLPDVDHQRANLQVGQRGAERQHRRAGHAVANDAGDVGIGVAVLPLRVDEARSLAALERRAVTVRAERAVDRGDVGWWRRRELERRQHERRRAEADAEDEHGQDEAHGRTADHT